MTAKTSCHIYGTKLLLLLILSGLHRARTNYATITPCLYVWPRNRHCIVYSNWLTRGQHQISCGVCGHITSARWQVTLCDTIWHVSSRSVRRVADCYAPFAFTYAYNSVVLCLHALEMVECMKCMKAVLSLPLRMPTVALFCVCMR